MQPRQRKALYIFSPHIVVLSKTLNKNLQSAFLANNNSEIHGFVKLQTENNEICRNSVNKLC